MTRNVLLVFSNPSEGNEDAYNHWYDHEHLQEVVGLPEFVSARRFRLAADQAEGAPPCPYRYLAIYEFEGGSKEAFARLEGELAGGTIVLPAEIEAETIAAWGFEPLGETLSSPTAPASGR
jgi:hypothetical protein